MMLTEASSKDGSEKTHERVSRAELVEHADDTGAQQRHVVEEERVDAFTVSNGSCHDAADRVCDP